MPNPKKKLPLPKTYRQKKADLVRLQVLNEDGDPEEFYNFDHIAPRKRYKLKTFVHEYVKDFNGAASVRRMGLDVVQPARVASEFLNEPFVQWYLQKFIKEMDERAIVTRNDVLVGLLREANAPNNVFANSSTRVNALKAIAKILGMEITKVEGSMTLNGGVMAIPMAGSLEEWEKVASAKQAELKQEVRK